MKINVPNNIKSPTVIVIGSPEHQEQKNDWTAKRMDILEKKLDQQYKAFVDKSDYSGVIEKLQSSFNSNLTKMMAMNKAMMTRAHRDKNITLKPQIVRVGNSNNKALFNSFNAILQKLENAIYASRPRLIPSPS